MSREQLRTAQRVAELERVGLRYRQGVVTDDSPLTVELGGDGVSLANVSQLDSAGPLAVGDVVAVLSFATELLVIGKIAAAAAWTNVGALSNSWVDHATFLPPRYRREADRTVRLEGCMKNGTNGATAFTLPAGYRPSHDLIFTAHQYDGANVIGNATLRVNADGTVKFFGTVTLAECWVNCTFVAA